MKIGFVVNPALKHQVAAAALLRQGAARLGDALEVFPLGTAPRGDVLACWGWRIGRTLAGQGQPVLVLERGYLGDRQRWTALGWDGLNGRARFPACQDDGRRWEANFAHLLQPWKVREPRRVLLIGQVPNDASLLHSDHGAWLRETAAALGARPETILRYRPHPLAESRREPRPVLPAGTEISTGPLGQDLKWAELAVTFNSNSGVEAVLAGVPTVAWDAGAMAGPVAGPALDAPPARPSRTAWSRRLAWCQWGGPELADGSAWAAAKGCMASAAPWHESFTAEEAA